MEMFQRDLPLSLDLLNRVIESYRRENCRRIEVATAAVDGERCGDSTPILKEFIPLKPTVKERSDDDGSEKMSRCSWLKSAQLWNDDKKISTSPNKNVINSNQSITLSKSAYCMGGFQENKVLHKPHHLHERQRQQQRKERRCWSTELHRRFVHTLQLLGGPYVATPKQIRQILQVDGLTNDEVKSHLQKYRMHTKWSGREMKIGGGGDLQHLAKPFVTWEPRGLTYSNQLLGHRMRSAAPFQY